jgi:purine-nucleoside phosphorylase
MLLRNKIEESRDYIHRHYPHDIDLAIVLGTGLSSMEELFEEKVVISYHKIPHFPMSTVEGHNGRMLLGKIDGKNVLMLSGRFHFYEGYEMDEVTYYVHVLKALKTKQLIITNAAGGLNPHYDLGQLVLVKDHINLFPINPLRGIHDPKFGPMFPDLMRAYPQELRTKISKVAKENNISLKEGVYLGWQGPSLETPAEYKMARNFGADVLGMSSIPEVIVAKYRSIPVIMISVASNKCYPQSVLKETTLEEVIEVMNHSGAQLKQLLTLYIKSVE